MKLRLQYNSIRLRLKRSEVEQFARLGRVEERIVLGSSHDANFHYTLEAASAVPSLEVVVTARSIIVRVPIRDAVRWASTDEVSIEDRLSVGGPVTLRILIEKDFACLDGTEEQNADSFPNPLASRECQAQSTQGIGHDEYGT
jgi:hypothetical protein